MPRHVALAEKQSQRVQKIRTSAPVTTRGRFLVEKIILLYKPCRKVDITGDEKVKFIVFMVDFV